MKQGQRQASGQKAAATPLPGRYRAAVVEPLPDGGGPLPAAFRAHRAPGGAGADGEAGGQAHREGSIKRNLWEPDANQRIRLPKSGL
jgi:hypothetical protein